MKWVRRAGLKLGEMQIELPGILGLRVNEERPNADDFGRLDDASQGVDDQGPSEAEPLRRPIDIESSHQYNGDVVATGAFSESVGGSGGLD